MAVTTDFWGQAPHDHVVQFYERDHELAAVVGPYLADVIQAGGVAIVIATEAHRQAFAARLADEGINPAMAQPGPPAAGSGLVMLDAREAADWLLIDGRIAAHRFENLIGGLVRKAAAGGRPVRAYGEIVAVLWADGHVGAALELEELWNGLRREIEFSLYCGYPLTQAGPENDVDGFHEVCRLHSAVLGEPAALEPPGESPLEVEVMFRSSRLSPGLARRFVTETLAAWGCPDLLEDAALIVTELATNAVLHAGSDFTVVLSRRPEGAIRIAVRDSSLLEPRIWPRRLEPLAGGGRGLGLVEAFACGWGSDLHSDGKVVWAELERTRPKPLAATPLTVS